MECENKLEANLVLSMSIILWDHLSHNVYNGQYNFIKIQCFPKIIHRQLMPCCHVFIEIIH